jgi:hypothetical protein
LERPEGRSLSVPVRGKTSVDRSLKECKLLVLGALADGPKNTAQIQRQTGLKYGQVYLAAVELHNERKIDYPAARVG